MGSYQVTFFVWSKRAQIYALLIVKGKKLTNIHPHSPAQVKEFKKKIDLVILLPNDNAQ
jgi:hypothetical protein